MINFFKKWCFYRTLDQLSCALTGSDCVMPSIFLYPQSKNTKPLYIGFCCYTTGLELT